jgi:hypothetical protein
LLALLLGHGRERRIPVPPVHLGLLLALGHGQLIMLILFPSLDLVKPLTCWFAASWGCSGSAGATFDHPAEGPVDADGGLLALPGAGEITDGLVELLIATVRRINALAETRTTREQFVSGITRKVTGKVNILSASRRSGREAAGHRREGGTPQLRAGLEVLLDLVREFESKGRPAGPAAGRVS